MVPSPKVNVQRIAQLEPGDLFVCPQAGTVGYIGLVTDHKLSSSGDNLALILSPPQSSAPLLLELQSVGVSLGKDFTLRFPIDPQQWSEQAPQNDFPCLLVSGKNVFFLGIIPGNSSRFPEHCFVDAATGATALPPSGSIAYARSWEIITLEQEPRSILKYPL